MQLFDEFTTLVGALSEAAVDHAVVGGLAVAIWGAPRATGDIDLLVRRRDLGQALALARRLGFDIVANPMKFSDGSEMVRATKFEGGEQLSVDFLLTDDDGPEWRSRVEIPFGAVTVKVVSREALIDMKARAARPKDLQDVISLREVDR